jgi:hypothetical protein
MNPRTTWLWTGIAAALLAFIFLFERRLHHPPAGPPKVLPALQAASVSSIRISPKGQLEIRAERTNGLWRLTRPLTYPAQTASVDGLLAALARLTPATVIPAQELRGLRRADEQFGFAPPQTTLVLQQGDQEFFVHIGFRTGPGDQVFLQVVGMDEVYVVDTEVLAWIPNKADDWRDTCLADLRKLAFDRLVVTNAGKVFELQRNPTNQLWRIMISGWEPRADSTKVEEALRLLQNLRAEQFVSDDPKADLDSFGLQTPELSLALAQGTNSVLVLEFGKSPTNSADQLYARRADQSSVVIVAKDLVGRWRAPQDFRDRHLAPLSRPPDEIEVRGGDNFILQRQTNDTWRLLPQDVAADPALVGELITNLSGLQVAEFFKDVVTAPDLPAKGLASPVRQFILKSALTPALTGPTNLVLVQLDFGTNQEDKVFARRADESSIYTVRLADFQRLPSASWQLRQRQIWSFIESDVAQITIHQDGKTREIIHRGTNSWSLAPGSQGIINDLALEEVVHRLGTLVAVAWVEPGDQNRASYGFTPDTLKLTVELKDGRKLGVEFGGTAPSGFPYAMTRIDGQPWVFEFPWALYQFVLLYLTIPAYLR